MHKKQIRGENDDCLEKTKFIKEMEKWSNISRFGYYRTRNSRYTDYLSQTAAATGSGKLEEAFSYVVKGPSEGIWAYRHFATIPTTFSKNKSIELSILVLTASAKVLLRIREGF